MQNGTHNTQIVMYIVNDLMLIITLIRFKYIFFLSLKIIREKYNYILCELIKCIIFMVRLE